jgi:prevent-host-death family protein
MEMVPAFEAKTKLGELLDRVIAGEEIVITRHGRPVARLIAEGVESLADIRRAGEGLEGLQKEIASSEEGKKSVTWKDFKAAVEEGRR